MVFYEPPMLRAYESRRDEEVITCPTLCQAWPCSLYRLLPEELLTEDEVMSLVKVAEWSRDRAFISMLYDFGGRISQIRSDVRNATTMKLVLAYHVPVELLASFHSVMIYARLVSHENACEKRSHSPLTFLACFRTC